MGDKIHSSHLALYRKYRSKSLDEIVGQEHVTKVLKNAIKQNKINHAYLFTGPRGTGKTSIARILAHEINNFPYNDEKSYLDIIEIDAASNRRIDDIRDLREKVNIAPVNGKYKVYIIDEVHMLTTESFNALLKTLEEPPAHVVFILATTEVHKLPATIISRVQRHSFHTIPIEQVVKHLSFIAESEGIDIDQEALKLLAEHGGGSFRDSISLLDQISSVDKEITADKVEQLLGIIPKTALSELIKCVDQGNPSGIISSIEKLIHTGLTPQNIALQLTMMLREKLKSSANQRTTKLVQALLDVHSSRYPN